jgi:hypothetical protein
MAGRVDVEYHAFRAGLKPAIRLSAEPGRAAPMVERYTSLGCAVVTAEAELLNDAGGPDRRVEVLYVARSLADAEALRAAEEPIRGRRVPVDTGVRAVREVGLRLGYPACCVEACCERYHRRVAARGFRAAQAWYAARDAWVPAPRWQIDDLMFAARASIISFEPCTYVCDAATKLADDILAVIAKVDAQARADLERKLRRNVAIDARGGRAVVTLDRGTETVITAAEPLRGAEGQVLDAINEQLAPTLAGKVVTADGSVAGTGDHPVLVVAFAG